MEKEFMEKVLTKLDKEFQKINAKLDEHDREFEEIANNFKMINTKLDKHDKEFRDLKRYWFVFEDKVTTELPALFDGYSANIEKSTEIEFRQNATEKKVELDSLRISILEDNFKKHDEQLSKLLAE